MEWECACKFCLRYKYNGPPYEDPLTFKDIESQCTCEACMQIHYFKKHRRCEKTWMESIEYCPCATCWTNRRMGGLFANVIPTSGCICKPCREIRIKNYCFVLFQILYSCIIPNKVENKMVV